MDHGAAGLSVPAAVLALIDAGAWVVIHGVAGYAAHRTPDRLLEREWWWSAERAFERGGRTWRRTGVRRWKRWLPEAGDFFAGGFNKAKLVRHDRDYLLAYARETRRAELSHLLALAAAPLFFAWNPAWLALCMVGYAVVANVPCVVSQRYNRLRVRRVLARGGLRRGQGEGAC